MDRRKRLEKVLERVQNALPPEYKADIVVDPVTNIEIVKRSEPDKPIVALFPDWDAGELEVILEEELSDEEINVVDAITNDLTV